MTSQAVEAAEHPAKLGEEVMAALHRVAKLAHARLRMAALGRLQAQAGPPCPGLRRAIALSPLGLRAWQVARIKARDRRHCRGRLHHQGVAHVLSLPALIGIGSGYDDSQRQGAGVTGYVQRRPPLAAIHGAGPSLLAPFFAGFLEPSSNTSSQLIPCKAS